MVALEFAHAAPTHATHAVPAETATATPPGSPDQAARPHEPGADPQSSLARDGPVTRDGSFLLDVAHELRSPLLSFNLSLGLLVDGSGTLAAAEESRLVRTLQRSAVHLQTLIENLLDAATIDTRRFSVVPTETQLADVVDEAVHVVEPLLGAQGHSVSVELPALVVRADGQRLRQVLVNLLHNAITHGPPAEAITVRAHAQGESVLVEVADRGPGIPPDEQPFLFERFYRGHAARGRGRGSGLGLAIAQAIVQAHGGRIGLRNDERGTAFWFTVPLA